MKRSVLFLTFFAAILLTSCNENRIFSDHQSVAEEFLWLKSDVKRFRVDVKETGNYTVTLALRHSMNYQYRALLTEFTVMTPDKKLYKQPVKIDIRDESGFPKGSAMGDIVDVEQIIAKDIAMSEPGTYMVEIRNAMPQDSTDWIIEIGLMVDKSE